MRAGPWEAAGAARRWGARRPLLPCKSLSFMAPSPQGPARGPGPAERADGGSPSGDGGGEPPVEPLIGNFLYRFLTSDGSFQAFWRAAAPGEDQPAQMFSQASGPADPDPVWAQLEACFSSPEARACAEGEAPPAGQHPGDPAPGAASAGHPAAGFAPGDRLARGAPAPSPPGTPGSGPNSPLPSPGIRPPLSPSSGAASMVGTQTLRPAPAPIQLKQDVVERKRTRYGPVGIGGCPGPVQAYQRRLLEYLEGELSLRLGEAFEAVCPPGEARPPAGPRVPALSRASRFSLPPDPAATEALTQVLDNPFFEERQTFTAFYCPSSPARPAAPAVHLICEEVLGLPYLLAALITPFSTTRAGLEYLWACCGSGALNREERFYELLGERRGAGGTGPEGQERQSPALITYSRLCWLCREMINSHPGYGFVQPEQFRKALADVSAARVMFDADLQGLWELSYELTYKHTGYSLSDVFFSVQELEAISGDTSPFGYEAYYAMYCGYLRYSSGTDIPLPQAALQTYGNWRYTEECMQRVYAGVGRPLLSSSAGETERASGGALRAEVESDDSRAATPLQETGAGSPDGPAFRFADFVLFYLAENVPESLPSQAYWFALADYDGDGLITAADLAHFLMPKPRRPGLETRSEPEFAPEDTICMLLDSMRYARASDGPSPAAEQWSHVCRARLHDVSGAGVDALRPHPVSSSGEAFVTLSDVAKSHLAPLFFSAIFSPRRFQGGERTCGVVITEEGELRALPPGRHIDSESWHAFSIAEYENLLNDG